MRMFKSSFVRIPAVDSSPYRFCSLLPSSFLSTAVKNAFFKSHFFDIILYRFIAVYACNQNPVKFVLVS